MSDPTETSPFTISIPSDLETTTLQSGFKYSSFQFLKAKFDYNMGQSVCPRVPN